MLGVRYLPLSVRQPSPEHFGDALGVIGFGVPPESDRAFGFPFARADLPVLGQSPLYEIWISSLPITLMTQNGIDSAHDGETLFGVIQVEEVPCSDLESTVYSTYLRMFDHAERAGYPHLLRVYHYLPGITEIDGGLERYRRFSIGRYEAFAARRYAVTSSPAASALGSRSNRMLIYFLTARSPGTPLENPRQVSAFRYPPQHGPRSPTFTRAAIGEHGGNKVLFVSGTASIVGHESKHRGEVAAQTSEIVANIRALLAECEGTGAIPVSDELRLKVYVRK
jgi:chorismate lyase / 3-hydroxybenzoate synthase